ncbi:TraR/DksA C4-type zinc finger protein [Parasalinivibrio latis]|uniref:TraR/DksA C4-type zinc finger protein n=1 Tax=Parasalinivibrio latis TaxID=2952610 RepID=UPI0030E57869
MPDVFDHASGIEAKFQQMALDRQLATSARSNTGYRDSAKECVECGDPIPEKRRQSIPGCIYCTHCQELADKGLL